MTLRNSWPIFYCFILLLFVVLFQNLIAMKASQFTGYAQHDAQEFMAYLLLFYIVIVCCIVSESHSYEGESVHWICPA